MSESVRDPLEKPVAAASFAAEGEAVRPCATISSSGDMPDMMSGDNASSRRDQALDWLLRVQQAPQDAQVQAELAQWCQADPANASAYRQAERLWRLSAQLAPKTQTQWPQPAPAEPARVLPAAVPARPVQRSRRTRTWLGGAVAACLMLALAPSLTVRVQSDYRTGAGETREVRLSDGSVVQLDSDTALAVDYLGDRRDVRLLKGQAFFQVVPDTSRPFHVRAEAVQVTVTGTAFNVALDERVSVAVQQGSVNVDDWRAGRSLARHMVPGQRLDYQAGEARLGHFSPSQAAAWRQGQLVADDLPIAEVVAQLKRYVPGLIVLRDDAGLASKRVTGVYDLRHPEAALRAVVQPHGGRVERYSAWVLVVR
mgnify:CR=1 FL=1